MGNEPQKQIPKINKTQLQVACTKAKIHLQMMRDRKNAQIIKGQRQLVAKLKLPARNKIQQLLIAQRVTNGLKYAQACNQLAAYAASLKSQANYIAQNVAKFQKIQPWLMYIYSLEYGAEHLGLSSLNQFKLVVRSMSNPIKMQQYTNKDIKQLLLPSPTPQQLNIYILEMSERNQIPLEQINIVGHKFTRQWSQIPTQLDQGFLQMKQKIAQNIKNNFDHNNHPNGPGNSQGSNGHQGGNQGYGQGGNQGYGQGGNQGFDQGSKGNQGFNKNGPKGGNQGFNNKGLDNPNNNNINPYKGLSNIQSGPQYYQPSNITPQSNQKPKQFPSFEQIMNSKQNESQKQPIYPSINPNDFKSQQYKPIHNPFTPPEQQEQHNSPTLSQIMRDFDKK